MGNMMIGKDKRAVMNDWDYSFNLKLKDHVKQWSRMVRVASCIGIGGAADGPGTWPPTADGKKPPTILDDLESFFWVLVYTAIHDIPTDPNAGHCAALDD